MKVLFVAGECVPFVKSGGLADVIGSLPGALKKLGIDVRVVIPKFKDIDSKYKDEISWIKSTEISVGSSQQFCGIESLFLGGITYYFIDNKQHFDRPGLYGFADDNERFSFFSKAVIEMLPLIDFKPDIIHCHDWHSGLVPVLLEEYSKKDPFYSHIKRVFTIHNLRYQGLFSKDTLETLHLDESYFSMEKLEYYNQISFMKGGIVFSDLFTTVSPTYAGEIKTCLYGEGLDGLINHHHLKLRGIVNGIDYGLYNPQNDPLIHKNYGLETLDDKSLNKLNLQEKVGLPQNKDIPLVGIVSRLTEQKGLDLLEHVMDEIMEMDLQMVVLGTGERKYEESIDDFASKYPHKLKVISKFDNKFAHSIYAGCDMYLMPSLFEPCGLSQLIALRYGSIPIVRETGGLKDTVIPYNQHTGEGNGLSFRNYNAHEMLFTLQRAVDIFYNSKHIWYHLVRSAMESENSWEVSAKKYMRIYKELSVFS